MREILAIEFGTPTSEQTLVLELDNDANNGVSQFGFGDDVFIRARTPLDIVDKRCTVGKIAIDRAGMVEDVPYEQLLFEDALSADLQHIPSNIDECRWLGDGLGNVRWDGKTAYVAHAGYGVLHVKYSTIYTRLKLSGVNLHLPENEPAHVFVWAEDSGGRKGKLSVLFGTGGVGSEAVYFLVKDFCTDLPIAGANVYVDDTYRGVTGADGRLFIGTMLKGSHHTCRSTAAGYKDSVSDALANDEFTVP